MPSNPTKDGALIFLWGGLRNASGDTLLQDVLTWGANGNIVTNPNIWYVTPWYLWGGNSVIGSSIHGGVSDTIVQALTASNCNSAGAGTWETPPSGHAAFRDLVVTRQHRHPDPGLRHLHPGFAV